MSAGFNWLEETGEIWTIAIETAAGTKLKLEKGGTVLKVGGKTEVAEPSDRVRADLRAASPSSSRRASPRWTARRCD